MPTTRNAQKKASSAARNRNNQVQDQAVQGPPPGPIVGSDSPAPLNNPPAIPISSTDPTPIPTTKRARDEELERLAVEEGRLRVLKLRKEIDAITGPLPDNEDDDSEGEIPQIIKDLSPRYPQTKPSILLQILEDKFDPFDLYKLHTEFGSSVSYDAIDDEFFVAKGKLGTRKRLGSPKDLGSVKRWSNAFLQYVSIISIFKKHDIVSALLDFHAQILKLDDSYQWEAIVLLALRFHRQRITVGLSDGDEWRLQPHEIFGACNHAPKTPAIGVNSTRNARARLDDQICLNWNSNGCTFPNCLRRHVCVLCKGSHTKANHPDARAGDAKTKK
jgi:hypothetical protein